MTTLSTQLNSSNVEVTTASGNGGTGNITLNLGSAVSWNSSNTLTLTADNDIIVNVGSAIVNTGSGGLILAPGQDGSGNVSLNGTVSLNSGTFTAGTPGGAAMPGSFTSSASGVITLTGGALNVNATGAVTLEEPSQMPEQ